MDHVDVCGKVVTMEVGKKEFHWEKIEWCLKGDKLQIGSTVPWIKGDIWKNWSEWKDVRKVGCCLEFLRDVKGSWNSEQQTLVDFCKSAKFWGKLPFFFRDDAIHFIMIIIINIASPHLYSTPSWTIIIIISLHLLDTPIIIIISPHDLYDTPSCAKAARIKTLSRLSFLQRPRYNWLNHHRHHHNRRILCHGHNQGFRFSSTNI